MQLLRDKIVLVMKKIRIPYFTNPALVYQIIKNLLNNKTPPEVIFATG
jgi:hypothetical protein